MIKQMTKYDFVIFHKDAGNFLQGIQTLGVVDITRKSKPIDNASKEMFEDIARYKKVVRQLVTIKEQMIKSGSPIIAESESEKYSAEKAEELLRRVAELFDRKKDLESQLSTAKANIANAEVWGTFHRSDVDRIKALGYIPHFYIASTKSFDSSLADKYPLQILNQDENKTCFVILGQPGEEIKLKLAETNLPENPAEVEEQKAAGIKTEIENTLKALYLESIKTGLIEKHIANLEAKADLYLAAGSSDKAAENTLDVFTGFAPVENNEVVKNYLSANSDGVYYTCDAATVDDNPPIELSGNRFTRMFTMLTDMYGRPKYDEFDPTPYISIFFTLFFAMCMGDAGYGLMLIAIGIIAKKSASMKGMAPLITVLGVATFVIGIILHTFFGVDISQVSWIPAQMKKFMVTGKIAGYDTQMVLSVIIGVVHICVAMVVKMIYAVKNKGLGYSLGTIGWTLLIVGGVIIGAIGLAGVMSSAVTKVIIIVLGIVSAIGIFFLNNLHRNPLINFGSGLWESYNTVTGLVSDVLSYIRLYALGLAGGMLGAVFNQLAGGVLESLNVPGVNWLCFILIVVLGHALNLAMCCLGAFVHPLRLNFLEFFKNSGYEGSGKKYKPLTFNN